IDRCVSGGGCCDLFLFKASNRKNQATQTYFARHSCVAANSPLRHERDKGHEHSYPGTRTILWSCTRRNVNVDVTILEATRLNAQSGSTILDHTERGLRAFPHNFTKVTRKDQSPRTRHPGGLNEQNVTANWRPS